MKPSEKAIEAASYHVRVSGVNGVEASVIAAYATDDVVPRAELDKALVALANSTKDEFSMARRLRAGIVEARRRLFKGRALWNGPCHECDGVLEKALMADAPTTAEYFTAKDAEHERNELRNRLAEARAEFNAAQGTADDLYQKFMALKDSLASKDAALREAMEALCFISEGNGLERFDLKSYARIALAKLEKAIGND